MATTSEAEDYAPEMIEQYLLGWNQLQSAAEGGTGRIPGYTSSGRDRLGLACMVADLERAADHLPPDWASTAHVFQLQHRVREWRERGVQLDTSHVSLFEACEWMARYLGWK